MNHRRWVMLHGMPGVGKSTLAANLAASITQAGGACDLLPEEAIFIRAEFADVGQGFKTKHWPTANIMLHAYQRVLDAARQHRRWIAMDWNCVGMIEDLPWAQPDRTTLTTTQHAAHADMSVLVTHARDVRALAPDIRPILLVLNVPHRVAATRAATERGDAWIERYAAFVQDPRPGEPPLDRIVRWYEEISPRHEDIIDAYDQAGWQIAAIDATSTDDAVLRAAMAVLMHRES